MNGNYFELTGKVNYIEIKYANNGNAYTRVIIGKKKKSNAKEFESYVITFFGDNAENIVSTIKKGDLANVSGRMQITNYQDKYGTDVEKITLIGDTFTLASYDTENKKYEAVKSRKTQKDNKEKQKELEF